jgi:eukaryotic-like serine/threonine-protein kinase
VQSGIPDEARRARAELRGRQVALAHERTMRETRIVSALHHPHIVSIFDVVAENGER